jgi:hypothetical protein
MNIRRVSYLRLTLPLKGKEFQMNLMSLLKITGSETRNE